MTTVHIKTLRVDEDSIDVHGHVNNQEYLRWMQEIAIEHSTLQGWPMARYLELGASWYVKSHFIDYLKSAQQTDEILVCTWVATMESRRSLRKTVFLRKADHQKLARAETQWIFVDLASGRVKPVPEVLRTAFVLVDSDSVAFEEIERQLRPVGVTGSPSGK